MKDVSALRVFTPFHRLFVHPDTSLRAGAERMIAYVTGEVMRVVTAREGLLEEQWGGPGERVRSLSEAERVAWAKFELGGEGRGVEEEAGSQET